MTDIDKNIGETFEDTDWRMEGRRIRVLSAFEKTDPWGRPYPAYRVQTVLAPKNPTSVGNHSSIAAAQLEKRFRKVSH